MSISAKEDVTKRLRQSFDSDYYDSIFRQMNYAFGEPWNPSAVGGHSSGSMPYYPDISAQTQEVGRSRRILNAQFVGLSRVMYNDPEAEFPFLPKMEAEARKGFLLARWRGDNYGAGCWADEEHRAFMDGDGTGLGFLQIGLQADREGYQLVTVRHSPALMTLGDRHERSPDRWRYVAFVHYMPAEDAIERYGSRVEPYVRLGFDGVNSEALEFIRLFEYYDMGVAGAEPTRMVILGEFDGEVLESGENPFECLPFSHYLHFYAPGMRRPIGRILLQMATQEAINEVEELMRWAMQRGKPLDIIDSSAYDPQSLERFRTGRGEGFVHRNRPRSGPQDMWERVPAMEISQTTLARLATLEAQFNADSSTTEYERGGMPRGDRTATEVQTLTSRSATQGLWSVRQLIQFRERTFEKAAKVAAMYDRSPVEVEMFGSLVPVNVPGIPESSCEQFLSRPAKALVSEESMTFQDLETRRSKRLAYLFSLLPVVQMGLLNPSWWAEEVLKAGGEKDFRAAMAGQGAPMMAGPEGGEGGGAGAMAINNNILRGMQI